MLNYSNDDHLEKLWGPGAIRVFLSHKSEFKVEAAKIEAYLSNYGIASFVAHEDIEPVQEWVGEIELALSSMDVLVALLTDKFSESNWTDQEVGVAVGRGVLVIPIRLGKDPYGFIGKYQAISGDGKNAVKLADEIYEVILRSNKVSDEKKRLAGDDTGNDYIAKVAKSGSFSNSNSLARRLPSIKRLSPSQEEALVHAFNENDQIRYAFDFREIITYQLERLTGHNYLLNGMADDDGRLVRPE